MGAARRDTSIWRPAVSAAAVASLVAMSFTRNAIAQYSYGLETESVANYSLQGSTNLPNTTANIECFRQGMIGTNYSCSNSPTSTSWTSGSIFVDGSTYDSDFIDVDLQSGGADTYEFDAPGNAVGYFSGHGICSGAATSGNTPIVCTSAAQCNNPSSAAFEKSPGTCKTGPPGSPLDPSGNGTGICHYLTDRALYTSSSADSFGHRTVYSDVWGTRYAAWGESSWGGSWSGAGTNGGINLAVLDISCGVLPQYWAQQLQPAFAGLQYLATIMPVTGDTASVADRGSTFAHRWQANASEAMADAWAYVINDLPQSDGTQCAGSNYTLGGGHGINGCGCNFIISFDEQTAAYNKMAYHNWTNLPQDIYDATSNFWFYWWAVCNYDSSTYPWEL